MAGLLSWFGKKLRLSDASFWSSYLASDTASGKTVNPDTAMQVAAVWACVRLISETVGTLPLGLFRMNADGSKTAAKDHPLYKKLHDEPNADQTAVEYWECVVASLCLWGNHYAKIHTSGGRLISLEFLRPDRMTVRRNKDGARIYTYADSDGRREYTEDEIFHVRGFGVGLDVGLSPISYARQTIGAALATDETASKIFANGLQASGVLTSEQTLKPDQRTQLQNLMQDFVGSKNAGKMMVLESGLKFETLMMNPEDAQMLQTRSFNIEEVCRWFRVPPFMVGHTEKSTSWGTGLEQQTLGFLKFALMPYLVRISQSVRRQLIAPGERGELFAEHNLEGLLRADSAGRASFYSTMTQNGVYTRDEVRAKENLPPMPGGDVLTVQSNLVPLDQLGNAGSDENARSALKSWLEIPDQSGDQTNV